MSVLIRGMETPTSCYNCDCCVRDSDEVDYCCLLMRDVLSSEREEDCPLVEIPQHGRLIDADELKDGKFVYATEPYTRGWNDAIEAIIQNAPTIIEGDQEATE